MFKAKFLLLLLSLLLFSGCSAKITKIGQLSKDPIFRVQVGTEVTLRWPEIEFEKK